MNIADRMESFRHNYRGMLRELVLRGLSIKYDSAYTDTFIEDEIDNLETRLNAGIEYCDSKRTEERSA